MKTSIYLLLCGFFFAACSQSSGGAGSADFGSLSQDITYHDLKTEAASPSTVQDHYVRMLLKSDQTFKQYEVVNVDGTAQECALEGTWSIVGGDVGDSGNNQLSVTVTSLNGSSLSKTITYPLDQFSVDLLAVRLTADDLATRLVNIDESDFTDYQSKNPGDYSADNFCDR